MAAVILILIALNFLISWKGFRDTFFYNRFDLQVGRVLRGREYHRIISSGFLHTGWPHLVWNMIALYAFSLGLISQTGVWFFILVYFISLAGGKMFSLFAHRHHADYNSVGASGGVNGVIFASIAIFPGMTIGLFFLPLHIPAWIFGIVYIVYTIYGVRSGKGTTGHESHLGGALIGMMVALIIYPAAFMQNLWTILLIAVPALAFIVYSMLRPHSLIIGNSKAHANKYLTIEDKYNASKVQRQQEVDRILDKISRKGMQSLSAKEKAILQEYSKTIR